VHEPSSILDTEVGLVLVGEEVPAAATAPAQIEQDDTAHVDQIVERRQEVGVVPSRATVDHQQDGGVRIAMAANEQ
jgi:hypothetical protein